MLFRHNDCRTIEHKHLIKSRLARVRPESALTTVTIMPITATSHPYRVKIGGKVVAFPSSMSLKDVEQACRKLSSEGRPNRPKITKIAPKTAPKAAISSKSTTISSGNGPEEVARSLSELLGSVDPNNVSETEKQKLFQHIIQYRKIARSLPDESRSVLDRKIASFSNSQVKPKAAKKK